MPVLSGRASGTDGEVASSRALAGPKRTASPKYPRLPRARSLNRSVAASALGDDDLQIFAWHHHGAILRGVEAPDQRGDVVKQRRLARRPQRRARFVDRTVISLEAVSPVLR